MPKSKFIDFKAIKSALNMEQLLQHYGLLNNFKRSGDNLSGPCPIHKGDNPTQFRVSVSKNLWHCFSDCKRGGNALDFIAKMENLSIHAAALKAIEWFGLDVDQLQNTSTNTNQPILHSNAKPESIQPSTTVDHASESAGPNPPLKFRLEKLEREHPYLSERGLTLETIVDFGVGFCAKGMMAGRIAIPIHNAEGSIVAYCGRWPGEPGTNVPKYKLPQGFRKSLEVFNVDRALKESDSRPLVIVEGFFDCMKLHQHGCRKVVALMGSTMSVPQESLIRKISERTTKIILMLDEDDAGRAAREDIAARLARFAFVRIYCFDQEGGQPENLTAEEIVKIAEGVS